ncbi:MAG: hypothetical protein V1907_02550 [Candidatus Kerfeldbacteria bacterium]
MNFKRRLLPLAVLCAAFVLITPSLAAAADDQAPPVVKRASWGQIKALYRGSALAEPVQTVPIGSGPALIKPGPMPTRVTGWQVKPYAVNEFWRDPNNPGSGYHVVMFFRINTNMCRAPVGRLWKDYERDWLNGWMLWVRYPTANTEELMLFADGSFWWGHRLWSSAWGLSQQFELCF